MYFHLAKIILWSRRSGIAPRILVFEPGMVNVVEGRSRTGKSAVIPIMDYCLGSGGCAIPKKVIREACGWFGVVIQTSEGQKLFARRDPDEQNATEEMFVCEGDVVIIPDVIFEGNTNARSVKRMLDNLASLSHLDFAGGDVIDSLDHRPSFRDMMAFVFQPQNVVANRDVLFYRTDQLRHRNKLSKNILPYVLGAVSGEVLAAQHEIERIGRSLRRKEKELDQAKAVSSRWEAEMAGQLGRAREFGLIGKDASLSTSPDNMLKLLREVSQKTVDSFQADGETITRAVEDLVALEAEEARLSEDLVSAKARRSELGRLREGAGNYHQALALQRDRLGVSDWLFECASEEIGNCPICRRTLIEEREILEVFKKNLSNIELAIGPMDELPVAVDREIAQIRQEIDVIAEKLSDLGRRRRALTGNSAQAKDRQFQLLSVAHFLGQLGQALNLYDETHDQGDLAKEVEELKALFSKLESLIDIASIKRRKESALDVVSKYVGAFMPQLDNDHHNDVARLVVEDLTLRISADEGDSFLWSIGSGSNWLSYHISTLLALQCYFLDRKNSPVPSMLVFDQPSQVYFPERIKRNASFAEPRWDDSEDVKAVRQAFELLGKTVEERKGNLQIIVLDHAPEEVWGDLPFVTPVANWRSGEKLVPEHWPVTNIG